MLQTNKMGFKNSYVKKVWCLVFVTKLLSVKHSKPSSGKQEKYAISLSNY